MSSAQDDYAGVAWNASEGKAASSFRGELEELQRKYLPLFGSSTDEFMLEHTEGHLEFKRLVERHIDEFLNSKGLNTALLFVLNCAYCWHERCGGTFPCLTHERFADTGWRS